MIMTRMRLFSCGGWAWSVPAASRVDVSDGLVREADLALSHPWRLWGHSYNPWGREDVTDGRDRVPIATVRRSPGPSPRRRVPDARVAHRGRRRRPGRLAAGEQIGPRPGGEPRWVVDDDRGSGVPEHAPGPQ